MNTTKTKADLLVNSNTLYQQLKKLSAALPNRSVLPIIEGFLFDISDRSLRIVATNLEIGMTSTIELEEAQEARKVAVPASVILPILSELPEQPISITFKENTMQITANSGKYRISCEDGNDFPEIAFHGDSYIASKVIGPALKRVLYAASTDEDKAALNGVYITADKSGAITLAATDAHRLQRVRTSELTDKKLDVIIPLKASQIVSTLAEKAPEVKLSTDRTHAYFTVQDIEIACRLIDQKYPDFENVIPVDNTKFLEVDKNTFLKALKRVKIFANKGTYQVKLSIKGSTLSLESEDPDFNNQAKESVDCQYIGEDFAIGFNAELLYDTCNRTEGEVLKIEMSAANRPAIIVPERQVEGIHNVGLVMPIMLNSYE